MDPQTYTVRQLFHFSLMGGKSTVGSDVRGMRAHVPPTLQYFFGGGGGERVEFYFFFLILRAVLVELPRLKPVRYVRGPAPASVSYQLFCKRDAGKNFFAIKLLSLLLFTEASHSPE